MGGTTLNLGPLAPMGMDEAGQMCDGGVESVPHSQTKGRGETSMQAWEVCATTQQDTHGLHLRPADADSTRLDHDQVDSTLLQMGQEQDMCMHQHEPTQPPMPATQHTLHHLSQSVRTRMHATATVLKSTWRRAQEVARSRFSSSSHGTSSTNPSPSGSTAAAVARCDDALSSRVLSAKSRLRFSLHGGPVNFD